MSDQTTHESDFVVVGGGAAGCVLAARLSQDPSCQVVLAEAGPRLESPMISTPGAALGLLGSDAMYGDLTAPQAAAGGRQIPLPTGRGLGGGSSVNTLTWFQGHPADYDGWREAGAEGWGWDDMLPVIRRVEHHILGAPFHGTGGPMTIDFARTSTRPPRPSSRRASSSACRSAATSTERPGPGSASPSRTSAMACGTAWWTATCVPRSTAATSPSVPTLRWSRCSSMAGKPPGSGFGTDN